MKLKIIHARALGQKPTLARPRNAQLVNGSAEKKTAKAIQIVIAKISNKNKIISSETVIWTEVLTRLQGLDNSLDSTDISVTALSVCRYGLMAPIQAP